MAQDTKSRRANAGPMVKHCPSKSTSNQQQPLRLSPARLSRQRSARARLLASLLEAMRGSA
jgi:hypothetical protein